MSAAWLGLLVLVLVVLIVPTAIVERYRRSEYAQYLKYRKGIAAMRERYVPLETPATPKRTIVRAGVFK